MSEDFVEWVYDSLTGSLKEEYRLPGVENAFKTGKYCDIKYTEVYKANVRLNKRLGVPDETEDRDVNIIIDSMLDIQRELCCQMYRLGACFGLKKGPR